MRHTQIFLISVLLQLLCAGASCQSCALLFFGVLRGFDIVLPSIQNKILDVNPACHVYAHTYNISKLINLRNAENGSVFFEQIQKLTRNVSIDTRESFTAIRNLTYYRTLFPGNVIFGWKYPTSIDNMIMQWHSIERVWDLMMIAENKMNIRYQQIGLFRSDVKYMTPINIYAGNAVIPNFANWPMNDRLFFGKRKYAKHWATARFDMIATYLKKNKHVGLHSETFMAFLMQNIQVKKLPICFFRVRLTGKIKTDDCVPLVTIKRAFNKNDARHV